MFRGLVAAAVCVFMAPALAQSAPPSPEVLKDLAPTGKVRASFNAGNAILTQRDPATGEPKGVTADLARELARRLGVPVEFVISDSAGKAFAGGKNGAWDVGFLAITPMRAAALEFTAPYVIIAGGYMVPDTSPLRTASDVDRPGIRVAVSGGSGYDQFLTRLLKNATLVRGKGGGGLESIEMFLHDKIDVVAGLRPVLADYAKDHAGLRVLDGQFMDIQQAMVAPKGRAAGSAYLKAFVEDVKASGFVAESLKRSGQTVQVAPPAH